MANPQKENGNTEIANEIIEALAKIQLSGYESRVLWIIFRKTYGWHKKEDWITNTQIAEMTGITESHISRTIKILIRKKIVTKIGKKVSFQKDYDKWEKLPKLVTNKKLPKLDKELPKLVCEVTKIGIHKRNYTKETIQKKLSKNSFDKESVVYQLVIYLDGKIRENNEAENRKPKKTESQLQSWCIDMDKLIRIDKAIPDEIKKIIDWVVEDSFWAKNILCPASLRKQYSRFYKQFIDRGKSLEEKLKDDHRFDNLK